MAAAVAAVEEVPLVDRRTSRDWKAAKRGQAMVEFLLGLVGIMFLVAGLLQAREISYKNLKMQCDSREDMADLLTGAGSSQSGDFVYSKGHDTGNDKKMYTGDDVMLSDSPSTFFGSFLPASGYIEPPTGSGSIQEYFSEFETARNDPYASLEDTGDLGASFNMLFSQDSAEIRIMPFLRRIIGKNMFILERSIWMPKLDGLMEPPP
jgi:hypothetical protein